MQEEKGTAPNLSFGGIGIEPAAARAYLLNIAETLQHMLLPQLPESAHFKAIECIRTALHMAAALQPPSSVLEALAASADDQASARHNEGRAFELAFAEAEKLIESITHSVPPAGRKCDPERIEAWFRAQPRGGDALRLREARMLSGGRSKQTILVRIDHARELPRELVIRQDWAAAVTGTSVAMEFEILRRLHAAGIRVPEPLLIEPGAQALDAPFIVVSRLPGQVEGNLFDPPASAQPVRELAEQLGRTHAMRVEDFAGLPGITEHSFTTAQLRADLAKFRAVIEKLGGPLPLTVRYAMDWLDRTVERVRGPRTLVHGDVGFHNNLCDGEHLTAVLDWELAHLGNPALDLGYLKVMVERRIPWTEFMERYLAAGGATLDPFVIDWYGVYTNVWFMHLLLQARAAVASGALHDMDYAQVCAHYGPASHAYLSKRLASALSHGA